MFTDFRPRFTKRYNLTEVAVAGLREYAREVKDGVFPDEDHSYTVKSEVLDAFREMIERRRQV